MTQTAARAARGASGRNLTRIACCKTARRIIFV